MIPWFPCQNHLKTNFPTNWKRLLHPWLITLLTTVHCSGIMRSPESTEHSSYNTKMSVVVTLWVLTTYLMLQVPTLIRWNHFPPSDQQWPHNVSLLQERFLHILRLAPTDQFVRRQRRPPGANIPDLHARHGLRPHHYMGHCQTSPHFQVRLSFW